MDEQTICSVLEENQDAVQAEVLSSAMDEVAAEVGAPRDSLRIAGLVGVVANTRTRGKPDLLFYVRCDRTAEQIMHNFEKSGAEEDFEVAKLLFVRRSDTAKLRSMLSEDLLSPPSAALVTALLEYGEDWESRCG
eukprot:TRINITY_DN6396_c0_g1_i1.p2 TRINITY_DN6396_c0_g1~~TRINITY_DN6396_c0_g1_i1.p2  ORF type:complete len:135 (+),score=59.74 TRINITY_DN6396_c0_g1_i1:589-993(+)